MTGTYSHFHPPFKTDSLQRELLISRLCGRKTQQFSRGGAERGITEGETLSDWLLNTSKQHPLSASLSSVVIRLGT